MSDKQKEILRKMEDVNRIDMEQKKPKKVMSSEAIVKKIIRKNTKQK